MSWSAQAQNRDIFLVKDIAIDVTEENAVEARASAFEQAQIEAFNVLKDRLLSSFHSQRLDELDPLIIQSLVRDVSVDNEQTAPTRYRAEFSVRFDKNKTKDLFSENNLSYASFEGGPALVLPFLQIGEQFLLWDDPNPWREQWFEAQYSSQNLLRIVIPVGDLSDIKDAPNNLLEYSDASQSIENLKRRYGVEKIYGVAAKSKGLAIEPGNDGVNIRVFQFFDGLPIEIGRLDVQGDFEVAHEQTIQYLQENWKNQTKVNTTATSLIMARAFYSSIEEWNQIQSSLKSITNIKTFEPKTITKSYSDITITFSGTRDKIFPAMQKRGLFLSRTSIIEDKFHILKQL